jgi:hypothetical protein
MRYVGKNNDSHAEDAREVRAIRRDKNDCGLRTDDICEMFRDFMESAGFSVQNIIDYFQS